MVIFLRKRTVARIYRPVLEIELGVPLQTRTGAESTMGSLTQFIVAVVSSITGYWPTMWKVFGSITHFIVAAVSSITAGSTMRVSGFLRAFLQWLKTFLHWLKTFLHWLKKFLHWLKSDGTAQGGVVAVTEEAELENLGTLQVPLYVLKSVSGRSRSGDFIEFPAIDSPSS